MTRIAIYPGSFDPVTNGHLDIIQRGSSLTDHLIVAVARNAGKSPMFSIDERIALLENEIKSMEKDGLISGKVTVNTFTGLLIDYAEKSNANMILRGLRAVTDFEYEFQMTGMNYQLSPDIETVFLMSSDNNSFISSNLVKEVHKLGGDVSKFVSKNTIKILNRKNS